jgi:hypothetical protein
VRPIVVDFARPPRWPAAALWILSAVLAGIVAWQSVRQHEAWRALAEQRARTDRLQRRLDVRRALLAAQAASAALPAAFSADARRLMSMSSADIGGVLRSVESARVPDAKVLRLDIDAAGRKVDLELEVLSADAATAYLDTLGTGAEGYTWSLVRVQSQAGSQSALIRGRLP